jgi:TRAP-type C4-dicarboxylate transport system permease small subunit
MIERAIDGLAWILALVAGAALLLMMTQMALDVFMSNIFGRPIRGNLEIISVYHMVLVVFLPLAFVERRHEHITVDLFVRLMPRPVVRVINVLGYLLTAAFFAILAWQTLHDALRSFRINEIMMGSIYVTIWPAKFALPIGFFAVMLPSLLHAWKAATDPHFDPVPADPTETQDPA